MEKKAKKKSSKKVKSKYDKPGQPTKYRPEMCEELIKYAEEGGVNGRWYKKLGISHAAACDYRKKYPEFLKACKEAEEIGKLNLLEKAELLYETGGTNAQLGCIKWIAACAFRLRENDTKEEIREEVRKQLPSFAEFLKEDDE